mgnify:CR=1 FL=1
MTIFTKRVYDNLDADGYRLLEMRMWPRGVRKERVDGWDRGLAPSRTLLTAFKCGQIDWTQYALRFTLEMKRRPDSIKSIARLRECAKGSIVTVLCSCKNESRCHRTLLKDLVEFGSFRG